MHTGISQPMNVELNAEDATVGATVDEAIAGPSNVNADFGNLSSIDFDADVGNTDFADDDFHNMEIGDVDADEITDAVTPSVSSYQGINIARKLISQSRLNNICRKLDLSQRKSRLLAQSLKEDGLLEEGVTIRTQSRQEEFQPYFTKATDVDLSYCSNIRGLMEKLKIDYDVEDWRLFIDGSTSG